MTSRPILFSAPMVRAILSGAKTQTRRIVTTREPLEFVGGRGEEADPSKWGWFFDGPDHHGYMVLGRGHDERYNHGSISIPCPYGAPGDRLWVREEHYRFGHWEAVTGAKERTRTGRQRWRFVADSPEIRYEAPSEFRKGRHHKDPATPEWHKRLARFMPRGASRITLEVTEVRVQRLQEISDADACAEGVEPYTPPHGHISPDQRVPGPGFDRCRLGDQPHRLPFADLWDHINGKRAPWSSNPWVWCLTFRRVP